MGDPDMMSRCTVCTCFAASVTSASGFLQHQRGEGSGHQRSIGSGQPLQLCKSKPLLQLGLGLGHPPLDGHHWAHNKRLRALSTPLTHTPHTQVRT